MSDLSQMTDDEFMSAWTEAGERAAAAQAECDAFGKDHQRRLAQAEEDRKNEKARAVDAGEVDPSLDQTVGSPEENS